MNERQFRNVYKKAIMKRGDTAENLIGLLERRLDAVIYRSKLSNTIFSSRQLINHGHVRVNGKKVNISSYLVKEEDTISIEWGAYGVPETFLIHKNKIVSKYIGPLNEELINEINSIIKWEF